MKFGFLSLNLLLLWTCAFPYPQGVSYFSFIHNFYRSVKKCGEWHEICFSLSPLATIGTCAFAYAQPVSYFSILHNFYHSVKKCGERHEICFSLSPLATIGTCAFPCAQLVSYFSILHNFYLSVKNVVSDMKFAFLFLHLLLLELVHLLVLSW